jgi:hypothetical protein
LYPQSRIIYVTQKQKGELAEKALRLDFTDVESGWHHLFGNAGKLPEACRNRLMAAHSIFTFGSGGTEDWTAAVKSIAPDARIFEIDSRPAAGAGIHASAHLVDSLSGHPVVQTAVRQILSSIAANGIGMPRAANSGGPIVIHPGSGSREKCWPEESFLSLAKSVRTRGRQCRMLLGEVELEKWPAETIRNLESVCEVKRPENYVALFRELSAAAAFVGNDSGSGHLAGIMGVPTLSLFGPSDPAVWKPLGPRVQVIRRPAMAEISVLEVNATLEKMIGN